MTRKPESSAALGGLLGAMLLGLSATPAQASQEGANTGGGSRSNCASCGVIHRVPGPPRNQAPAPADERARGKEKKTRWTYLSAPIVR